MRQYVLRETAFAIAGGVGLLIGMALLFACWKSAKKHSVDNEEFSFVVTMISGIVGLIFCVVSIVEGLEPLANALAPIPGLLGV